MAEKKLLDQVRDAIRVKHYSYRTEQAYVDWNRRYILFHNLGLSLSKSSAIQKIWARRKRCPEPFEGYKLSSPTSQPNARLPHPHRTRPSAPSSSFIASSCRVGLRQKEINLPP